jgi:hypothetical protein
LHKLDLVHVKLNDGRTVLIMRLPQ